jgi:alkylated DNA repair protein (DNA oxidative demethylase)
MNLFSQLDTEPTHEELFPGAVLMRGLALPHDREMLAAVESIAQVAPFRHTTTASGLRMLVMSTNCGNPHRFNDNAAFRTNGTSPEAPETQAQPTARPPMPELFRSFAVHAAALAGFPRFRSDAGHINRYHAGIKLGLHQDRHECDLTQPIVSVSFGLQAVFLLGGLERTDKPRHILLEHGDVIVWGGPSRMRFHGVQPLKPGSHMLTGPYRYNLTFRRIN